MNYKQHYQKLIERSQKSNSKIEYREKHHIIPLCFCTDETCNGYKNRKRKHSCGLDEKENISYLTPEEHYVAHQLLMKMYPKKRELLLSVIFMTTDKQGNRVNNKLYGWLKRKYSKHMSVWMRGRFAGDKNPMKDPKVVAKVIKSRPKIRPDMIGDKHFMHRPEIAAKVSIAVSRAQLGTHRTHETRRRMSVAKKLIASCIHCHKTCNVSRVLQFHGDNCKHKNFTAFKESL